MSEAVQIHVVRRADLREQRFPAWNDPAGLAAFTPQKRAAILDNPLLADDNEPVQLIGMKANLVIGRIDLIRGEHTVKGQRAPILWGSEWTVPPEHRNTLVGVLLLLKLQAMGYDLGAFGPSQMAVPVYQKLKWADIPLARWVLIRRSRPVVERYLKRGPHATLAAAVVDVGLAARSALARGSLRRAAAGLNARPVERCPADLDPLLGRAPRPVSPYRSAAWINWALTHSFNTDPRTRLEMHVAERAGRPAGYFIVKRRFYPVATSRGFRDLTLGSVHDWMSFGEGATDEALIALAVQRAAAMGVDAVEVCTAEETVGALLARAGFRRAGEMHILFKPAPESPLADPSLHRASAWHARPGDGDNFLI